MSLLKRSLFPILFLTVISAPVNGQSRLMGFYKLGEHWYKQQNYTKAIPCFDSALALYPYFSIAYFKLAYCHYNQHNYKAALCDNEKDYAYKNLDNKYFYIKAECYDKLNKPHLTLYYLSMAINYAPSNSYYFSYRGAINLQEHYYRKAVSDYSTALSIQPDAYPLYYTRGLAEYDSKQKSEACADWFHARDHDVASKRYYFYECNGENASKYHFDKPATFHEIPEPVFLAKKDTGIVSFCSDHLNYPDSALLAGQEGMVILQFTITKEGKISDITPIFSAWPALKKEAVRVLKMSEPYWKPAQVNGSPVDYTYVLPFSFSIKESGFPLIDDLDSIHSLYKKNDFKRFEKLSRKVLQTNPFNREIYLLRKQAFKKINHTDTCFKEDWFTKLMSVKATFLPEVSPVEQYVKFYFNKLWEITTRKDAAYYRIAQWGNNAFYYEGKYADYTINGHLFSTGKYLLKNRDGRFRYYYPNGKLKEEMNFSNNIPTGTWKLYFPDGQLRFSLSAEKGRYSMQECYDSSGNNLIKNGTGKWKYVFPDYKNKNNNTVCGELKGGKRTGHWQYWTGKNLFIDEDYKAGYLVTSKYFQGQKEKTTSTILMGPWIFIPASMLRTESMIKSNKITGLNLPVTGYSEMDGNVLSHLKE